MKKIIICLFLVIATNSFASENLVLRTESLQIHNLSNDEVTYKPCDVDIVITDNSVIIYSSTTQIYDMKDKEDVFRKDGYQVYTYICVDRNGLTCKVLFWLSEYKQNVVRIGYNDYMWEYFIKK